MPAARPVQMGQQLVQRTRKLLRAVPSARIWRRRSSVKRRSWASASTAAYSPFAAAEMIIDRRHVHMGPFADLFAGHVGIAALGRQLPCRFQDPGPGQIPVTALAALVPPWEILPITAS